ncbi:hypothetical protein GDO78_001701 [Eleutherodactylus coqui]|uniref:Uncharacterized protein n=1 Tax=Eleutherodactylus coqui TaxID=57060 RepID=A0A8J6FUL5_ELECQ|nr:hypothetical protein GDO78_001701 [Eleutherodactylus coqui]
MRFIDDVLVLYQFDVLPICSVLVTVKALLSTLLKLSQKLVGVVILYDPLLCSLIVVEGQIRASNAKTGFAFNVGGLQSQIQGLSSR